MTLPKKVGIYLCEWNNGGKYYNLFDGKNWCWGMSTFPGVENAVARVGKEFITGEHTYITKPFDAENEYVVSYELVAELGEMHE